MDSLAHKMKAALAEKTRRLNGGPEPKPPSPDKSIRPTKHDLQTPLELKSKPTFPKPGDTAIYQNPPVAKQPVVVEKRAPLPPAVTIHRASNVPETKETRPSHKLVANATLAPYRDPPRGPEYKEMLADRQRELGKCLQKTSNDVEQLQRSKGKSL